MKPAHVITVLAVSALGTWWLSGFDAKLGGGHREDRFRRGVRCGFTLLLLGLVAAWPGVLASFPVLLVFVSALAFTWTGCLKGLIVHSVERLDGPDGEAAAVDPQKSRGDVEVMKALIQDGRRHEALRQYDKLKESGDANVLVLDALLDRAGIRHDGAKKASPLAEADRCRAAGKFEDAEIILKALLVENPANVDAAMMLMQLYVENLHDRARAQEVLRVLAYQPRIASSSLDYARRSIDEWGRKKEEPRTVPLPGSVEELLRAGYLGTAIEVLEERAAQAPGDFDAQLKLAEAHGLHSGNVARAQKIVAEMQARACFSAQQMDIARKKLEEWGDRKPAGDQP